MLCYTYIAVCYILQKSPETRAFYEIFVTCGIIVFILKLYKKAWRQVYKTNNSC